MTILRRSKFGEIRSTALGLGVFMEPTTQTIGGKYELIRLLGKGGAGCVWEAKHNLTQQHLALKVLQVPENRFSETSRARFLREARAPSSLDHPGVPNVFDAGEDGDLLYIAMELVEGEDLSKHLKQTEGPSSSRQLLKWMIQTLQILEVAHAKGLIHRDIKPANLFITQEDQTVRLMDFGTVRLHVEDERELTAEGAIIGTPAYMSPEQASGEPATERSDLWGVGAVMFHALTGRPPVGGNNPLQTLKHLIHQEVESVFEATIQLNLDRRMLEVIDRALQTNPEDRWASATQMKLALESCLLPAPPPPAPATGSGANFRPTLPKRSSAFALLGLALVLCAGGLIMNSRSEAQPTAPHAAQAPQPVISGKRVMTREISPEPLQTIAEKPAAATPSPTRVKAAPKKTRPPVVRRKKRKKRRRPVNKGQSTKRLPVLKDYQ